MTVLDYILIGILVFFAILGLIRGLVSQLISILGLIAGFVLARIYYGSVVSYLGLHFYIGEFLAFLIVFVGVFICAKIVGMLVEKFLKSARLSLFNRISGFLLGFMKGFALCSLIIAFMLLVYPEGDTVVRSSPTASYFYKAAEAIYRIVPEDIRGKFKPEDPGGVREEREPSPSNPDKKNGQNRF